MRKACAPESIFHELRQQISADTSARGLLGALHAIEIFAEPHRLTLVRCWVAQWRRCAEGALGLRPALRKNLPECCEYCGAGSDALIPIAYGLPGPWMAAAQDRGEVSHRGCLSGERSPRWQCHACGAEQHRPRVNATRRQRRRWTEFAHFSDEFVRRCEQDWNRTAPLSFRDAFPWSPVSPAYVRMVDRVCSCTTRGELETLVPEILGYDEDFLFPPPDTGWMEPPVWLERHNDREWNGELLSSCVESLRSIWWLVWRTVDESLPLWNQDLVSADLKSLNMVADRLTRHRRQIGHEWEALAQLMDDAAQSQDSGRLYVAVEATLQWRYEQAHRPQRQGWSESLVNLQENADRLARKRITNELTSTRPNVTWDALSSLLDNALEGGDVARLRVASIATTVWAGKWWVWWADIGGFLLDTIQSVDDSLSSGAADEDGF